MGLTMTVLEETFHGASLENVRGAARELRAQMDAKLSEVPAGSRPLVRDRVADYLAALETTLADTSAESAKVVEQYGCAFWRVVARPADSPAAPL